VATRSLESSPMPSRLRHLFHRDALGALVLTASIPLLFLHERYQPELSVNVGSTSIDARLSDAAVLAVVVAAAITAARFGLGRLRPARLLWVPGIALLVWLAFASFRPVSHEDALFDDHLVSFLKLGEYALLAVAVPLLVRRAEDLTIFLGGLILWAAVAVGVALLQFFGLDIVGAWNAGWRQPSFLGHHDLAALAAISVALASAGIVVGKRRIPAGALFSLALAGGALGLVVAGSVAAAGGLAFGAAVVWIASRRRFSPSGRRALALIAVVAVVAGGVTAVRGDALGDFLRFVGIRGDEPPVGVETYSQRTVLAYIGLRIWQDHPIVGVGWQRSSRPEVFEPYVPDARERFPDVVDLAFPAEGREWGVQNLYIQMLADAGVIGLMLLIAVGAAGLVLAWRTAAHAPNPWAAGAGLAVLCALLTLAGEWASLGIVAGIPLQAATCLLLGLAAAGAATVEEETGV
jgi:O-antigen ligase